MKGLRMRNLRSRRGALNIVMLFLLGIVLLANGGCGGSGRSESSTSPFAGGQGTLEAPYQIATAEQLAKVKDYRDKSFILVSDIDLSSCGNWDPIGTFNMEIDDPEKSEPAKSSLAFVGRFDGDGHTISNLTVNRPETVGVGLFGFVMGNAASPSIRNLTLSNADVKGACMVGGVVGVINGRIADIKLTGVNKVEGYRIGAVGGMVGMGYGAIENYTANANRVEGYMVGAVGGIAGMGYGAIENCSANASVTSNGKNMQGLGLICGGGKWLTVRACTATGNVTAKGSGAFSVGGLVGCIQESPVMENCAVKATIDASAEKSFMVGGLTGHAGNYDKSNPTLIRNCSADVDITVSASSKRVGGLIGGNLFVSAFLEEHPTPSLYRITGCATSGSIKGNASQIGSIAGYGYDSSVTDCTSTLVWSGGPIEQVGLMHSAGDTPDPIGKDYYAGE